MGHMRKVFMWMVVWACCVSAFDIDSLFEPLIKPFDLLPDYYLRFELSTFALHQNAFFKRQYLAEPHPDLEFCFLSYKNLIASVWQADFQFGLGEIPGNNVFTVLNVAFGYNPTIELRLPQVTLSGGLPHRCFHEIDRSEFPLVYYNKLQLKAVSPNSRANSYWRNLQNDSAFCARNRFAWSAEYGYYIKGLGGLADPGKLNGNNPLQWELQTECRYALYQRRSWIVSFRGASTLGQFDRSGGYRTISNTGWFWKQMIGFEAFFTRGQRGGSFYVLYHLDDLPVPSNSPVFTLGNSRFSKSKLAQIGVSFLN